MMSIKDNCNRYIIPGLPNEIAALCLAKVPMDMHTGIRSVSKTWNHVLQSVAFYSQDENGLSGDWIYVRASGGMKDAKIFAWNAANLICLPLPPIPGDAGEGSYTVLGGTLFSIGSKFTDYSSNVYCYNPRSNSWLAQPQLKFPRKFPIVGTVGGKIYVLGGCKKGFSNWGEVYNPAMKMWTPFSLSYNVSDSDSLACQHCIVWRNKLYVKFCEYNGHIIIVFSPPCSLIRVNLNNMDPAYEMKLLYQEWIHSFGKTVVVKDIPLAYVHDQIRGFDDRTNKWIPLEVSGANWQHDLCKARLANIAEKLCLIWKSENQITFSCMEIHHMDAEKLCAKVLWSNSVVTSSSGWILSSIMSSK